MSSKSFNDHADLYKDCGKVLTDLVNTMTQCWYDFEGDPLQGYFDDDGKIADSIAPLKNSLLPHLESTGHIGAKYLHEMLDLLEKHAGTRVEGIKADYNAYMADHRDFSESHKALLDAVKPLADEHIPFPEWFSALQERVRQFHAANNAPKPSLGA